MARSDVGRRGRCSVQGGDYFPDTLRNHMAIGGGYERARIHRKRLVNAGFRHTAVWLRNFNFVSIVAIR